MEVMQTPEVEELQKKSDGDGKEVNGDKAKTEESEVQNVKKSKEERKRKKDDKSIDQVLKALSTLATTEEKLAAICNKYAEIVEENRKMHLQVKQSEKRNIALQREKDQIQSEQSKTLLTRSRLENLCRELQRQNKAIKEESLLKIREEEEKRKVVSAKFQIALGEITALIQQDNENNSKLRDENLEMQNKFKTLCEQYELREQQVEKMSKQMQLESQLSEMKLAKVKIDMFAEKEVLANEKEQLLVELTACQNKCQKLQKTEAALRNQITMYNEKYDEFQSALAKSNQIYSGFKCEMEKMSKKITKLEKETSIWKMKWEGSHKALLQMAAEKQQRDADLALTTRQLNQLQKLCRTLQAERTSLLNQLKNDGNHESTEKEKLTLEKKGEETSVTPQGTPDESSDNKMEKTSSESSNISGYANQLHDENISENGKIERIPSCICLLEWERERRMLGKETPNITNNKQCTANEVESPVPEEDTKETVKEINQSESALEQDSQLARTSKHQNGKQKDIVKSSSINESRKGKDASKKKKRK